MIHDEILHKWINGTISPDELEVFKKRPEYEELKALYDATEDFSAPSFDQQQVLDAILQTPKISDSTKSEAKRRFLPNAFKYAAAIAVILFASWWFWPKNIVTYQVAKFERLTNKLPDQSVFILNAESTLTYDKKQWETERRLKLKGEATFKVEKGSTFTVETPDGLVQVVGTEFNVRSRNRNMTVKCFEGKVAVFSSIGKKLDELTALQALRVNERQQVESWTMPNANNWSNGISSFKNVALSEVLEELERQFDVQINASQVDRSIRLSCNFQHKNIEAALKNCLTPLKIKYQINGKNISLSTE